MDDHDDHMSASRVFVLVDRRKTLPAPVAQFQDHLGHKYRSGMQQTNAGSTGAGSALRVVPLCHVHLVVASRSYTCVAHNDKRFNEHSSNNSRNNLHVASYTYSIVSNDCGTPQFGVPF